MDSDTELVPLPGWLISLDDPYGSFRIPRRFDRVSPSNVEGDDKSPDLISPPKRLVQPRILLSPDDPCWLFRIPRRFDRVSPSKVEGRKSPGHRFVHSRKGPIRESLEGDGEWAVIGHCRGRASTGDQYSSVFHGLTIAGASDILASSVFNSSGPPASGMAICPPLAALRRIPIITSKPL